MELTRNQSKWFSTATKDERLAFMAKGDAHCAQMMNRDTGDIVFAPFVRGIRLSGSFKTHDEAIAEAEKFLSEIEPAVTLDEKSLGITGECTSQMELCEEYDIRICDVVHIGSLMVTEGLNDKEDFLDLFLSDYGCDLNHHSSIKEIMPEEEIEDVYDMQDHFYNIGVFGFALQVSKSVEFGRQLEWFYAETFDEAFGMAVEWAKEMDGDA